MAIYDIMPQRYCTAVSVQQNQKSISVNFLVLIIHPVLNILARPLTLLYYIFAAYFLGLVLSKPFLKFSLSPPLINPWFLPSSRSQDIHFFFFFFFFFFGFLFLKVSITNFVTKCHNFKCSNLNSNFHHPPYYFLSFVC
jgi:hypothetical protein